MSDKRAQIKKYFAPFPTWAVIVVVVGLFCLGGKGGVIAFGLALVGIGGFFIYNWFSKPSDSQMDEWLKEDLAACSQKAMSKTHVDSSELVGESLSITGLRFWDTGGADFLYKRGKDNIIRFTPMNVTVFNMTPNQLLSYQAALDLTTGNTLNEQTDEYFYRDVVSVATKTDSKTIKADQLTANAKERLKGIVDASGAVQLNTSEKFVLTTSGGTSIEVVLRDEKLINAMGGGTIPITAAEKAIQTVRKMLREKKQA